MAANRRFFFSVARAKALAISEIVARGQAASETGELLERDIFEAGE